MSKDGKTPQERLRALDAKILKLEHKRDVLLAEVHDVAHRAGEAGRA